MATPKKASSLLLKPSGVLNWALQNLPRLDDTRRELLRFALNPPRVSLGPINRICAQLAEKKVDLAKALENTAHYRGYLKMAAEEVLPPFAEYLENFQIETTDAFQEERFPFPIGELPNGETSYLRIEPTFYALEGEKVIPTFLLAWTKVPFTTYQKELISSIIYRAVMTRQGFIGSDGRVLTFQRDKWSKARIRGGWNISQYASLTDEDLQKQFDRYTRAVREVVDILDARPE